MASRIPRFSATKNIRDSPKTDDQKRVALMLNKKVENLRKNALPLVKKDERSRVVAATYGVREVKVKRSTSCMAQSSSTSNEAKIPKLSIDRQCKGLNRSKTEPVIKTKTKNIPKPGQKTSEVIGPKRKVTIAKEKAGPEVRQSALSHTSKCPAPKNEEAKATNIQLKPKRIPAAENDDLLSLRVKVDKSSKPDLDGMCKNLGKITIKDSVKHATSTVLQQKKKVSKALENKPAVRPKTRTNPCVNLVQKNEFKEKNLQIKPKGTALVDDHKPVVREVKTANSSKPTLDQLCKKLNRSKTEPAIKFKKMAADCKTDEIVQPSSSNLKPPVLSPTSEWSFTEHLPIARTQTSEFPHSGIRMVKKRKSTRPSKLKIEFVSTPLKPNENSETKDSSAENPS